MKSKNREKAAQAIEAFLRAIGESSETNVELRGTGARVADMFMDELCAGNQVDPRAVLLSALPRRPAPYAITLDLPSPR